MRVRRLFVDLAIIKAHGGQARSVRIEKAEVCDTLNEQISCEVYRYFGQAKDFCSTEKTIHAIRQPER